MTRFWTRIIHPFQQKKRKNENKKKLPVAIAFDQYARPPSYLKESYLYGHALVRIDRLEKVYNQIQLSNKKKSLTFWRLMDPFIQVWYSELDRVSRQGQNVLELLNLQLQDVSHTLCAVLSPLKNRDRQSLKQAQQFIHTCIKEWDQNSNRNSCIMTTLTAKDPSLEAHQQQTTISTKTQQHELFLETALQHKTSFLIRDSQLQIYYQELQGCLEKELKPIRSSKKYNNARLRQCMRQVYSFEQDMLLFHHYITSQFSILRDIGNISLMVGSAAAAAIPNQQQKEGMMKEELSMIQVLRIKLDQKLNQQLKAYQELEINFGSMLKSSTPNQEDFTCTICLSILNEPTTLSGCHHTFCKSCIQHLFCALCHKNREKKLNSFSENLGRSLLMKPLPVVYCTCYIIDSATGEVVLKNPERACPLCRMSFKPSQCIADVALEKFISLYFPKRRYNQENDQEMVADETKKKKRGPPHTTSSIVAAAAMMGSSSSFMMGAATIDIGGSHHENITSSNSTRRRNQISSAGKFYSKMQQRWSNKQWTTTAEDYQADDDDGVPTPPVAPPQPQVFDNIAMFARRSWMF